MKRIYKRTKLVILVIVSFTLLNSCDDFLDREPLDRITPSVYLTSEADLSAYTINAYDFSSAGGYSLGSIIHADDNTDNQAQSTASYNIWVKGEAKVPSQDGNWNFSKIRNCNYFFEQVIPRWKGDKISGSIDNINHYIGEMYFLRAYEYFKKLKIYGDFPIVKNVFSDNEEELITASRREPRNMVARFIIQDLDSAIMLMQTSFENKNRLTKDAALLFKSRVALYEATWLKYHQGTPFVPGGPGWPGASSNPDFTINLDDEINYFLSEAMEASEILADKIELTSNSGIMNPPGSSPSGWNDYFEMFSTVDQGIFPEVIFWRDYSKELGITNAITTYIYFGGNNSGFTKNLIDSYLMKNGLPIYAANSNYFGDSSIMNQKKDRDDRLQLFVPGELDKKWLPSNSLFGYPKINNVLEERCVTGFHIRKCYSYDPDQLDPISGGVAQYYGIIIFRGVEAYLNYIEASYLKENQLNGKALTYWGKIRTRAGVSDDIQKTIDNTDLSKEDDWAKYSGNELIDRTLFNIRRERRDEFIGEGMRWDDLKRWRSLDQVNNYIIEGFNLWDEAYKHYVDNDGNNLLIPAGTPGKEGNVSNSAESKYLRPYQIVTTSNNKLYNGYNWTKANYLSPIPIKEMLLTAQDPNDVSTSVLYQNPYWPSVAGSSATE